MFGDGNAPDLEPEEDAAALVLTLLARRPAGATACPSEVARALAGRAEGAEGDWRAGMPAVHAAVDRLAAAGRVRLSWKGVAMPTRSGPYRIGRGEG